MGSLRLFDAPDYDVKRFCFANEEDIEACNPFHETRTARLYLVQEVVVKIFTLTIKNQEHLRKTQHYASKVVHLPNHPNICKVGKVDLKQWATIHCAYVQGLVLSQLIHNPGPQVECSAHRLIRDMLRAVRFLINHSCIWGDISTENIFLLQDQDGEWLFRLFDPSFVEACFGSGLKLDYCDPARAKLIRNGFNDMDLVQNDYWASMVCVFELKAGRKMFKGMEQMTKLYKLVHIFEDNDQEALNIVDPGYWKEDLDVYHLLQQSMRVRPEDRIPIGELEDSILPLLEL